MPGGESSHLHPPPSFVKILLSNISQLDGQATTLDHFLPSRVMLWQTHTVTFIAAIVAAAATAAAAALQVTGRLPQVLRVALAVPPGAKSRRTACGTNSSATHQRVGQIF